MSRRNNDTIHAASLVLAIHADALAEHAGNGHGQLEEGDLDGLTVRTPTPAPRRVRGNIPRMIGQARQECLRALREGYEEGAIGFEELMELYKAVDETAKELAWERWLTLNPEGFDYAPEVEEDNYYEDGRKWAPVREDWYAYEDHAFRAIVPCGDVLGFGGVA